MNNAKFDVTAIGNAIVDVLAKADDALLVKHNCPREACRSSMPRRQSASTQSWARVSKDRGARRAIRLPVSRRSADARRTSVRWRTTSLGDVFNHDIRAVGVTYNTPRLRGGLPTARCLIFVTPDAQRTMQTFLGAATQLGPEDVDMNYITASKVLYLEGYLWDQPLAKKAMREAAIKAQQAGVKVSLTLSDSFCVARFRDEFLDLVENHVDILFANESEILSLYQVENFDDALQHVRKHAEIAALTRSEKGSVVVNRGEVHVIDAVKGVKVVDTTGAGDAYAAGFLYAYTQGRDLATGGRLGGVMAAEVISHMGPRAEADVKALASKVL